MVNMLAIAFFHPPLANCLSAIFIAGGARLLCLLLLVVFLVIAFFISHIPVGSP